MHHHPGFTLILLFSLADEYIPFFTQVSTIEEEMLYNPRLSKDEVYLDLNFQSMSLCL